VSRPGHDQAQLGAYALGALDPMEARLVHDHLAGCLDCQREVSELMMIRRALDQVPPEAFVDGPPEDGELLLQRTLRQVRAESAPPRRRVTIAAMAAAVAVGVALAGGVLLGRETVSTPSAAPSTATSTPSNARFAEATDPDTGTVMTVALEPKKGWVWVHAEVTNLPVGARCELFVIPRDGKPILAGSWLVSEEGSKNGTRLEGTALIPPSDVAAVQVRTEAGQTMVTVPV
jgi:hypothetical protein